MFWFGQLSAPVFFLLLNSAAEFVLFIFLSSPPLLCDASCYILLLGVVPLPSKVSTVPPHPPKLLPSWAIFSFGYLSVIASL